MSPPRKREIAPETLDAVAEILSDLLFADLERNPLPHDENSDVEDRTVGS